MISVFIGGRELFQLEETSQAGDVVYIERFIRMPDGSPTCITKVVLSAPVASDVCTRAPLFDYGTCQVSAGW